MRRFPTTTTSLLLLLALLLLPSAFVVVVVQASDDDASRKVTLTNECAAARVGLYWVNPANRGLVELGDPVQPRSRSDFNSFVGHEFELHELPDEGSGECSVGGGQECHMGRFTVNEWHDQVIVVKPNFEVEHTTVSRYPDGPNKKKNEPSYVDVEPVEEPSEYAGDAERIPVPISECHERAKDALKGSPAVGSDVADATLTELVSCLRTNVTRKLQEFNEELNFQKISREAISEFFENYTCADEGFPTSEPIENRAWDRDNVVRDVSVLLDRDASKVHVVSDFISDEECQAMEDAAKPQLHKATVADGKGGSELSKNRKAMQAGIKVNWAREAEGDHIAILSRRVYDYVNHVTGLAIEEHGQEDLMSIQYFGRGGNDTEPDRYMPHCDGDCTGMRHKTGTRMATMVMYCTVPERGGATNFKNSGLHVKPQRGNAIFFSYMSPDMVMDKGFTEHSGCPVIEGEKKIVTQWVRYGVDAENPWDSFNTLGIKRTEEDKY